jgi:hypothetical protein
MNQTRLLIVAMYGAFGFALLLVGYLIDIFGARKDRAAQAEGLDSESTNTQKTVEHKNLVSVQR